MPTATRKSRSASSRSLGRRRIHWGPTLGLLLVTNLAAGLVFSPVFSLRKVRVQGVASEDEGRVESILKDLKGIPVLRIDPRRVETDVMNHPEVRSADFRRNLFGRGFLQIEYRRAVARILSEKPLGLTEDGIVFPTATVTPDLPVVRLPSNLTPGLTTIAGDWPSVDIAKIAVRVARLSADRSFGIILDAAGAVSLNMESGKVKLGSCDQLDAKLDKLDALITKDPELLRSVKALNLMTPARVLFEPLGSVPAAKSTVDPPTVLEEKKP